MKTVIGNGIACFVIVFSLLFILSHLTRFDSFVLVLFSTALLAGIIVGGITFLNLQIQKLTKSEKD